MEERKYIKKLVGDSVYLSPVSVEDFQEYTHMINDINVALGLGYFTYAEIVDYEKEKELLKKLKNDSMFAVRLIENNELLGNVGFNELNKVHRNAVLGIMLGNPKHQGKGYGKEAMNLLLDYGFSFLNLESISLNVFEYNEIAYNLYKKIGFKEVGRLRKNIEVIGKRYDVIIMDILKDEFESPYIKKEVKKRYRF